MEKILPYKSCTCSCVILLMASNGFNSVWCAVFKCKTGNNPTNKKNHPFYVYLYFCCAFVCVRVFVCIWLVFMLTETPVTPMRWSSLRLYLGGKTFKIFKESPSLYYRTTLYNRQAYSLKVRTQIDPYALEKSRNLWNLRPHLIQHVENASVRHHCSAN